MPRQWPATNSASFLPARLLTHSARRRRTRKHSPSHGGIAN